MAGDASPPQQSSPSTLPSLTNPSPPESSPQTPPPPNSPPPSPLPPEDEDENSPPPPPASTNNQQPPPPNQPLPINQPLTPVVPSTNGGTQPRVPILTPHRETPKVPNKPVNPEQSSPDMQDSSSSSSSNGSSSTSSSSSSDHKILIAGLVAGSFVLLFLILICVVCITRRRRRRRNKSGGIPAYAWDHGPPPQGNQYWKASPQDPGLKMYQSYPVGFGTTNNYNDNNVLITGVGPMGSQSPMPAGAAGTGAMTLGFNKSSFSYEELASATNGFSQANMLGQGGFGYVHKGVLPNGKEIAVKRLKSGSGQGEREFQAEVDIISRVHHRHLVSLVGYCIAPDQRILVYEFVSNNNLEYHLHDRTKGRRPPLDFSTRLGIALGSAKGLGYLHEDCHPRIIHRDIKASNILLDDNFEAMVADFGLAKLTSDTNTHVSTRVMGTFGYLAPEYASSGKLTEKSDVFSFGVMLLELITGRRPVDPDMKYMEDSLVDWARPLLTKALDSGNYDELADPELERNFNRFEMQRMVACAAASIRHSAKKRPKMSQIVRVLEGDVSLEDLNEGVKPGQNSIYGTSDGSDYDTRQYSADLKNFRRMAFSTQNFASSEYGGTTTEYGLNPPDDMIHGEIIK